jgi:hypothetical protein
MSQKIVIQWDYMTDRLVALIELRQCPPDKGRPTESVSLNLCAARALRIIIADSIKFNMSDQSHSPLRLSFFNACKQCGEGLLNPEKSAGG